MQHLDDILSIGKLDSGKILESIKLFGNQMQQVWNDFSALDIPSSCKLAKNLVVSGMGGSALGGRVVDSFLLDRLRAPIEISTEYRLPSYVNKESLVIVSSYSGNTEETLSSFNDCLSRGATVFVISSGGELSKLAKENNVPAYIFTPTCNPSGQPRMGLGYSIAAILSLLAKCEFLNFSQDDFKSVLDFSNRLNSEFNERVNESQNTAKLIADKLQQRVPILVASEHLTGCIHAFKNQLNENSKTFSYNFDLPELNHHLMEGLKYPAKIREIFHFCFIESDLYSPRVRARYPVTKTVLDKNGFSYSSYKLTGGSKMLQVFEIIILGMYVSFYLAMLNGIDPAPIPWVDFFKDELKKQSSY